MRDRRVFTFRRFTAYDEVRDEIEDAQIVFLTPTQLDLLPAESVDLFVNISSLLEMRPRQIAFYLRQIDRLRPSSGCRRPADRANAPATVGSGTCRTRNRVWLSVNGETSHVK